MFQDFDSGLLYKCLRQSFRTKLKNTRYGPGIHENSLVAMVLTFTEMSGLLSTVPVFQKNPKTFLAMSKILNCNDFIDQ